MKRFATIALITAAAMAMGACETTAQRIGSKEDSLAAAGFNLLPANTPKREAELHKLPPNKFVTKISGDNVRYVYADPVVCNCLYVGDQKAYGAYRKDLLDRQLADEQNLTASLYEDDFDWAAWDWGPWGY
jgi:hypothetical protein